MQKNCILKQEYFISFLNQDHMTETAVSMKYLNDIITRKIQAEPEDVIDYCSYLCSCA